MTRPLFVNAWAAASRIYDPINSGAKVAQIIGGKVAANIAPNGKWKNTCAVRISYILNQSGMLIPYTPEKTVSGGNKQWHFYYVRDVIAFLRQRWGEADQIIKYPLNGKELHNKKGLILFRVNGWVDADGHATLWNGNTCYDQCYFNEPGINYQTNEALFWELK